MPPVNVQLTKPQLLELLNTTCPRCQSNWALKWDPAYKQWFHEHHSMGAVSITICLGTNLRETYKDILNG